MGAKHFGARVTRFEDPALLAGRGRFVDDIAAARRAARLLRAQPAWPRQDRVRSTRRRRCALPGVHAVFTAADLPEPMRTERIPNLMANPAIRIMRTQHALARDEVCYVGQAVAVVIADSRAIAEDAAALVAIDYDVAAGGRRLPRGGRSRAARARMPTSPTTSPRR